MGLHPFHDSGGLGGTATGIRSMKGRSILFVGQIINKQGNIHITNRTSIFCPKLDGRIVRDHIFSSISRDMVIDTHLQGLE